jgi:hypothetical protein
MPQQVANQDYIASRETPFAGRHGEEYRYYPQLELEGLERDRGKMDESDVASVPRPFRLSASEIRPVMISVALNF